MAEQFRATWKLVHKNSTVTFVTSRELSQAELDAVIASFKLSGYLVGKNREQTVLLEEWQIAAAVRMIGQ